MGCWGMGVTQSDQFRETYEEFMERYNNGEETAAITHNILTRFREEFGDDSGILHDIYFALAKAEWMCGQQSEQILSRTRQIIQSEENLTFYREMGATDAQLKLRKKNLDQFYGSLQIPRNNPRKRRQTAKPKPVQLNKGDVFWYRSQKRIFCAIVLEEIKGPTFLIALSQELGTIPKKAEEVMDTEAFSALWFSQDDFLPENRVHKIGVVRPVGQYNGRAGMYYCDAMCSCGNKGHELSWDHEVYHLEFPKMTLRQLLKADNITMAMDYGTDFEYQIERMRRMYGEDAVKLL